jgi:hypothetical protein
MINLEENFLVDDGGRFVHCTSRTVVIQFASRSYRAVNVIVPLKLALDGPCCLNVMAKYYPAGTSNCRTL